MTLGPWIGGILADTIGYRYTFMAGGVILLMGGLLVLFGTRERFVRPSKETLRESGRLFSLLAYGGFPAMLALFFFFHFTVHFVAPILPLFIETMCDSRQGRRGLDDGHALCASAAGRQPWPPAGSAISATASGTNRSSCSISP